MQGSANCTSSAPKPQQRETSPSRGSTTRRSHGTILPLLTILLHGAANVGAFTPSRIRMPEVALPPDAAGHEGGSEHLGYPVPPPPKGYAEHDGGAGPDVTAPNGEFVLEPMADGPQLALAVAAALVAAAAAGLAAHHAPALAADGMGGTYVLRGASGAPVAVLKPADEEPLAPNNPRGNVGGVMGGAGLKPSVRVGEAALRETAAHVLDHGGFARVPAASLVRVAHPSLKYGPGEAVAPKLASLVEYVDHVCDTSDLGPARFATGDVHRIGILDIRLFNTDRHAGNMLVRRRTVVDGTAATDSDYELIPIDHGFCLPETLDAPYFEWLHWPQAKQPFSEEELSYIASLDAEADVRLLRERVPGLRPGSLRVLELTTALLKRCAEAGMTLYNIGCLLTRPYDESGAEGPSPLELMCLRANACPVDVRTLLGPGHAATLLAAPSLPDELVLASVTPADADNLAAGDAEAVVGVPASGSLSAQQEQKQQPYKQQRVASDLLARLWAQLQAPAPLQADAGLGRCLGGCCSSGGSFNEAASFSLFSDASWRWFAAQVLLRVEGVLLSGAWAAAVH